MMAITHAAISVAGTIAFESLVLGENSFNEMVVLGAIIGSQLPDLDTTKSVVGMMFWPIARLIETNFRHRTITHSVVVTLCLYLIAFYLAYTGTCTLAIAISIPLGHFFSIAADTCTKSGAALFWPDNTMWVMGLNPRNRIRTGSTSEYWVLAFACLALVALISLNNQGGLMKWAKETLQLPEAVEDIIHSHGATNNIYIEASGIKSSDRSPIEDKFIILGAKENGWIVESKKGIYWLHKFGDIQPRKSAPIVGETAVTEVSNLDLKDEDIYARLVELSNNNQNAAIYLTGRIVIDSPDWLSISTPPGQFKYIQAFGPQIFLENCPLNEALKSLKEQYAVGRIEVKKISPIPEILK